MGRWFLAALAALVVVTVTAPVDARRKSKLYDCEGRLEKARERFDRGWYNDAATLLDEIMFQCGGQSSTDTVIYLLAMAQMETDKLDDAKTHFKRLVDNYSTSAYYQEARFRVGQCSFMSSNTYDRDQTETRDAIRELSEFLQDAPTGAWADSANDHIAKCFDKLAHRDFASARFYSRVDRHDAAAVYYRSLIEEYPTSKYVNEAQLYLAQSLSRTNRVTEARAVIDELLEGSSSDDIKRRAKLLLARIENGAK